MDHVAAQDQLEASARALANTAYTMFTALQEAGFKRDEALIMVTEWLSESWRT